jgi:crossover junction endodeoxyribonuclease RuvC
MTMICGIDVGQTGAIALLYDREPGLYLEIHDMPVLDDGGINAASIAALFREFRPDHVLFEKVNSFGMGKQSAFVFGQGVGRLEGVLATMMIPHSTVTPAKWKSHLALGKDKNAARAAATRLFPASAHLFERKKDHGRAEAALIALHQHQLGVMR